MFIDVKPHDIFQREGNDLSCTVPVPLSLAVSGGRLKVPTLEGAATIKLPEGTQNGMIFRLRGKGVKALRGSDVGDMLVEVEVEIPSRLTKEQVDKLNAFASALDENRNQPACVEFADKAARYLKQIRSVSLFQTWPAFSSRLPNGLLPPGSCEGMKRSMPPRFCACSRVTPASCLTVAAVRPTLWWRNLRAAPACCWFRGRNALLLPPWPI